MALLESDVRAAGLRASTLVKKAASTILRESAALHQHFDIFLSHSIADETLVLGASKYLEEAGLTVYVDWLVDPQLDRSKVGKTTAETLRTRMTKCSSLVYLWSANAAASKWMPWELGYFDGFNGKVAILPIVSQSNLVYVGTEYVALYPAVDIQAVAGRRVASIGGVPVSSWLKAQR